MPIHRYDPRDDLVPIDVDPAIARARDLLARKRQAPDSVPFTKEQCEARVAHLELLKARQAQAPSGPNAAVARLLAYPSEVLADKQQWPGADDLVDGVDMLADAYRDWLVSRASALGGHWGEAVRKVLRDRRLLPEGDPYARALAMLLHAPRVPFPVGKACHELEVDFPAVVRELMPFDDDAHAALVLSVPVNDRPVTMFFPAHRETWDAVVEGERVPGAEFVIIDGARVRTDPPRPRGLADTRGQAQVWWKSMAGLKIEPGKRNRQRDRTSGHVIDALMAYKSEHNGKPPPSRDEFLEYLGIESTQWQRLIGDWGTDWDEIRRAVYGDAQRRQRTIDHG